MRYRKLLAHYYGLMIPAGSSVLEVGCGSGQLLRHINCQRKCGIDLNEELIHQAQATDPKTEFVVADATHFNPAEKYDYIIISDTLNSVPDVQELLQAIKRCGHDETKLLLNVPNNLWRPIFAAASALGLRTGHSPSSWLSGQDVRNLLQLADWDVVKIQARGLFPFAAGGIERLINRLLAPLLPWFCVSVFLVARPARARPTGSTRDLSVSVLVPARNEAGNIEAAITRTPSMGKWTEFIFVEGGSSDDTWAEVQRMPEAFPHHRIKILQQSGKGKGNAVREGFSQASGDLLMILDADLTMPPEELPKYYYALANGHCDFANGCRLIYPMESEAMRFLNMVANKTFGILFSWLLGQPIKDTLCGTKVLTRKNYERIVANRAYFGEFDPYGDFDLLFGADKLNLKIRDIPIRYKNRTYGTTNINRWTGGWLLLRMVFFAARKLKFV